MPKFREGSEDEGIWNAVYVANDYGLQGKWHGTVIDVGGHIGSFARFAVDKLESRQVISVEPNWSSIKLLEENTRGTVVEPIWAAVASRGGEPVVRVGDDWPNTGGARFEIAGNREAEGPVRTVTLDELVGMADYWPILIKLDCEGAEFDILSGWTDTARVGAVIGEWHGDSDALSSQRQAQLTKLLKDRGFAVSVSPPSGKDGPTLGQFAAHKDVT